VASHDVGHGRLCRIEKGEDGQYTVHYEEEGGKAGSCRAGVVMFGTGRHPNTHDIGLEARPVATPHKGVSFKFKRMWVLAVSPLHAVWLGRHPLHVVCLPTESSMHVLQV